jgi:hypothetical protein
MLRLPIQKMDAEKQSLIGAERKEYEAIQVQNSR